MEATEAWLRQALRILLLLPAGLRRWGEAELTRAVALADTRGGLETMASTRVMLGMYYTMLGRAREAVPVLEQAQPAAERLGAGLWKHRTRFMLAEPLFCLGQYARAAVAFRQAADLSLGAEQSAGIRQRRQ